jgi:hypothetical protein
LTRLVAHFSVVNNAANRANNFPQLTHVDTGVERAQDAAYTAAGRLNGARVPAFYTVATHVAVPSTAGGSEQYAIADEASGAKPATHGRLPGATSDSLAVNVKTRQGWRLANSVGVAAGSAPLPAFAAATPAGVTSPAASTKAAADAQSRVLAVASSCATQATSPLVAKPASCGGVLDGVRSVPQFHVMAGVCETHWPTYTVALTGGRTLVLGAAEVTVRVRSTPGVVWRRSSVVTGLLGAAAKRNIPIRHGYVEHTSLSVALVVPSGGGQAKVLAVESGDLSARRLAAPDSSNAVRV